MSTTKTMRARDMHQVSIASRISGIAMKVVTYAFLIVMAIIIGVFVLWLKVNFPVGMLFEMLL